MITPVSALRAAAALCACTLLLAACSMPKLLYGQADWLLMRQVEEYLELDDTQSAQLARAITAGMQRHRVEELPEIAATLRRFAAHARSGLNHANVRDGIDRARTLVLRSADLGVAPLSATLAALSAQQRAHLARRFDARNDSYRERHALDAPREQRLRRRAQRTVERIEDWTGPLTPEQTALVRAIRDTMPDSSAHWLAYTRVRQRQLLEALDTGASASDIEQLLRGSWLRRDDRPPALAAMGARQIDALTELLVRLDATLDSVQRAHLIGRLEALARDADALARKT